jgi:hypothetical protein
VTNWHTGYTPPAIEGYQSRYFSEYSWEDLDDAAILAASFADASDWSDRPEFVGGPLDGKKCPIETSTIRYMDGDIPAFYRNVKLSLDEGGKNYYANFYQYIGHINTRDHEVIVTPRRLYREIQRNGTLSGSWTWKYGSNLGEQT